MSIVSLVDVTRGGGNRVDEILNKDKENSLTSNNPTNKKSNSQVQPSKKGTLPIKENPFRFQSDVVRKKNWSS